MPISNLVILVADITKEKFVYSPSPAIPVNPLPTLPYKNLRPVPIQQRLNALSRLDLFHNVLHSPPLKNVSRRDIRILKLGLATAQNMMQSQAKLLVRVCLRVMLVDPAGETSADEFWVLCYGGPVGLVLDLRVYEGHFLRAGDALVSVSFQYVSQSEIWDLEIYNATKGWVQD